MPVIFLNDKLIKFLSYISSLHSLCDYKFYDGVTLSLTHTSFIPTATPVIPYMLIYFYILI